MVPNEPTRQPQLGYLYVPPYRVQGISVAGEQTSIAVPELDICFDIGLCPRAVLPSRYVALSHGHMDHAAALSYYFSQRNFQGMGEGSVICHSDLAGPIHKLMRAWSDLEGQNTPYQVMPLKPDGEIQIKNKTIVRGFATRHSAGSMGFIVVEKRSKLKEEFVGLEQKKIVDLKKQGTAITELHEIPLVCYTGDTAWGEHFDRQDVLNSKILIVECTFTESKHRSRANLGKHLHLDHIPKLLEKSNAQAVVLTHLSRRTPMAVARGAIENAIPTSEHERVFILMDGKINKQRYQQQLENDTDQA